MLIIDIALTEILVVALLTQHVPSLPGKVKDFIVMQFGMIQLNYKTVVQKMWFLFIFFFT
jgi:hypothetical protein